jgi:hypothetical protein
MYVCCFWTEICPKFEDKNLSEKFLSEMDIRKIDPWPECQSVSPLSTDSPPEGGGGRRRREGRRPQSWKRESIL